MGEKGQRQSWCRGLLAGVLQIAGLVRLAQQVVEEVGQRIIRGAFHKASPSVQERLRHLTVVATLREPLHELRLGESVQRVRFVDVFEVQPLWHVVFRKDFFDLSGRQHIEAGEVLVHGPRVLVVAPGSLDREELHEVLYEGTSRAQVLDVLVLRGIASAEDNEIVTQVAWFPGQANASRDLVPLHFLWRLEAFDFGQKPSVRALE